MVLLLFNIRAMVAVKRPLKGQESTFCLSLAFRSQFHRIELLRPFMVTIKFNAAIEMSTSMTSSGLFPLYPNPIFPSSTLIIAAVAVAQSVERPEKGPLNEKVQPYRHGFESRSQHRCRKKLKRAICGAKRRNNSEAWQLVAVAKFFNIDQTILVFCCGGGGGHGGIAGSMIAS